MFAGSWLRRSGVHSISSTSSPPSFPGRVPAHLQFSRRGHAPGHGLRRLLIGRLNWPSPDTTIAFFYRTSSARGGGGRWHRTGRAAKRLCRSTLRVFIPRSLRRLPIGSRPVPDHYGQAAGVENHRLIRRRSAACCFPFSHEQRSTACSRVVMKGVCWPTPTPSSPRQDPRRRHFRGRCT